MKRFFTLTSIRGLPAAAPKALACLLMAGALAWAVCAVWDLGQKTEFSAGILPEKDQFVTLFYSAHGRFDAAQSKRKLLLAGREPERVLFSIPRRKAAHLRLGFESPYGMVTLEKITLNGRALDFSAAFNYQKRNLRFCDPDPDRQNALLCRLAGADAYATFPPEMTADVLRRPWRAPVLVLLVGLFFAFFWRHYPSLKTLAARAAAKTGAGGVTLTAASAFTLLYALLKYTVYQNKLSAAFGSLNAARLWQLFKLDALIPALLLLGVLFLFWLKNRFFKIILAFALLAGLLAQLTDFALVQTLNARLMIFQIGGFSAELGGAWPIAKTYLGGAAGLLTLLTLAGFTALLALGFRARASRAAKVVLAALAAALLLAYFSPDLKSVPYDKEWMDLPRFYLSRPAPNAAPAPAPDGAFTPQYRCEKGLNGRENVILLIVESLSSYMSDYFSGMNDNTPEIDKLARENMAFTDYHTNNYNTVQGLFNLMTGYPLLHYYTDVPPFLNDKFYARAVPKVFRAAGYHTALFSSAAFVYSKDEILKRAGFDELHGDTDPFYKDKERFVFNSVSDDWLYARVGQWLNAKPKQPYFLVIETTTSHAPYLDPASHYNSFPLTLQFADKYAGQFVEKLKKDGFFENGILAITGDHRAMLPVSQEQYRVLGPTAESRVPLVIMGKGLKGVKSVKGTHADLGASLEYLALPEACFYQYQHNLFSPRQERGSCTLFQTLTIEKKALADCGGPLATVCFAPGRNDVCEGKLPADKAQSLMEFMTWLRENNTY